jgi:hypothetical protein
VIVAAPNSIETHSATRTLGVEGTEPGFESNLQGDSSGQHRVAAIETATQKKVPEPLSDLSTAKRPCDHKTSPLVDGGKTERL